MKTLYRVEVPAWNEQAKKAGIAGSVGPYRFADAWEDKNVFDRMLTDHMDGCHSPPYPFRNWRQVPVNHKVACPSMRSLFAWFGGWIGPLLREGAVIRKVTVPDEAIVWAGDHQVVFDSEKEIA